MTRTVSQSGILSRFFRAREGNFAMLGALLATPVILGVGMAIDFGMANREKTDLQDIADSAALAGGRVFDGTNMTEAKAEAEKMLKAQLGTAYNKDLITYSSDLRTFKVSVTKPVPTSFMKLASVNSVDVGVKSAAVSPVKPTNVVFTPTDAMGWWYKKINILVTRPGTTTEVSLATVEYKPTTRNNGGTGTMTVSPKGTIDLGKYDKLVLQMDIKKDSCPLGTYLILGKNNAVSCESSTDAKYKKFDAVLRTDNTATSHYLFVDGKQLPEGVVQPLQSYFGCNKPQSHAWEDGGGFDRQDFFYTVSSNCVTPDGEYVRLTE